MSKNSKWVNELNEVIETFFKTNKIDQYNTIKYFSYLLISVCKDYDLSLEEFKEILENIELVYKKEEEANNENG